MAQRLSDSKEGNPFSLLHESAAQWEADGWPSNLGPIPPRFLLTIPERYSLAPIRFPVLSRPTALTSDVAYLLTSGLTTEQGPR